MLLFYSFLPMIYGYNKNIEISKDYRFLNDKYHSNRINIDYFKKFIIKDNKGPESWNKTFGGLNNDFGWFVQQTYDGGYILTGVTYSIEERNGDIWLIKTDPFGEMEWEKIFGGMNSDIGKTVKQTSDGGYVLAGVTNSIEGRNNDIWLIKTDSNGNIEWSRIFGGSGHEEDPYVQQTSDKGYIIICASNTFGSGRYDFWVIKTDENGVIEWNRTYGGNLDDNGKSIEQTSDGGYILSGSTKSFGSGKYDFWVIKTDENGVIEWNKTYGGPLNENIWSIQQTLDCGFILSGCTSSYGNGDYDFWVIKTDENGVIEWNRTYGGVSEDFCSYVRQTRDKGYILIGQTDSFGSGKKDIWLIKINENGNILWEKTYGGLRSEYGWCITQTQDLGYIFTGFTNSFDEESFDFWLVKVPSDYYIFLDVEFSGGNLLCFYVTNYGLDSVFNVNWSFYVEGGLIISKRYSDGIIDIIQPGKTKKICCPLVYGIGKIIITVHIGEIFKIIKGYILGRIFFID